MTRFGIALSGEQHGPSEIVDQARRAEEAGLDFAVVSDHYHPWLEIQDESSYVWTALGGIARATDKIEIGTGVTCPTMRYRPAIVAQAAATTAAMTDGRFFLGVGTGERLNEHITGQHWPPHHVRLDMLTEAIDVMRGLWEGEMYNHDGDHYTVENAKIYTRPEEPPDLHIAAEGPTMAEAAGEYGDGLISTMPDDSIVEKFDDGGDRPHYGQFNGCYADSEDEALDIAHEHWRNSGLSGELGQELATPKHFEQASQMVEKEDMRESISLGTDVDQYVESIEEYVDAGFESVYVHQINPDADGFIEFFADEVVPAVS